MSEKTKFLMSLMTVSLISGFAVMDVSAIEQGEERILGGQVYTQPHRSSPEEFAKRKELYRELITLRNANRQRDSITLNMKNYRAIMEEMWRGAHEIYHGNIRAFPVCGELIPAEYQEPESKKIEYYNREARRHENFSNHTNNYPKYEQLICLYFMLSQEIDVLQKPLLDLTPETIYTMKNLEGRMEYLRKLLPELTKAGLEVVNAKIRKVSNVDRFHREHKYSMLMSLYQFSPEFLYFADAQMKEFARITVNHYAKAKQLYNGKIELFPSYLNVLLPKDCLTSTEKRNAYIKSRAGWYKNFCKYLASLPERDRLICLYIQRLNMIRVLEVPIRDLATDDPYPIENLIKRWEAVRDTMNATFRLKERLEEIEKQHKEHKR